MDKSISGYNIRGIMWSVVKIGFIVGRECLEESKIVLVRVNYGRFFGGGILWRDVCVKE